MHHELDRAIETAKDEAAHQSELQLTGKVKGYLIALNDEIS